ncbi:hypothetical protein HHX47_DHR2000299 [Lentinula edodes]|nr:hypothetical protein HHX47_DHR2000299 [Lentinula edodes]
MQQAVPTRKTVKKPLPVFDVGEDYELLYPLGEGAYGQVVAALHKPSRRRVAIKKVLPFEHTIFCLRTLREVKLLKYFSESCVNGNIISILDMIKPESLDSFKELYCTPTLEEFHAINARRSREYLRSMPLRKRQNFKTLFPLASADAIDFLQKTLTFDPEKRMTAEEALAHPYVGAYHDVEDEPLAPPLDPNYFEFDVSKEQLSRQRLKELLYEEVLSFESDMKTVV